MTLILTEISEFGIAMAADSAETMTIGQRHRVLTGVRKLQPIHYLAAGISCWGIGEISGLPTDMWLEDFIRTNSNIQELHEFALSLQNRLRREVGEVKQGSLGFHLAGFVQTATGKLPAFYHVHNGKSQYGNIDRNIDPKLFNANQDMPPGLYPPGLFKITRNGDYNLYAQLFEVVEKFLNDRVRPLGIEIPYPMNLNSIAEYLRFQIKTVSEIYRLSNLIPGIGGPVTTLTVSSQGITHYETR